MKVAAIGIGSNSLRMLLAEVGGGTLKRLKRYRDGLRMFAALDENQCIPAAMMQSAAEKVAGFCREAVKEGAEAVHIFATSAVRDSKNRDEFAGVIRTATGYPLDICDGTKEANLSFWGACGDTPCALIDIGGGSTELAIGCQKQVDFAESMQIGAVRLFRQERIENAQDAFDLAARIPLTDTPLLKRENLHWVGVGGTFTTCAALCQKISWDDKKRIHGYKIQKESVILAINELSAMSLEERMKLNYLQPQRADIIVHGLAILLGCFDRWSIPEIEVSEYGNL